MSARLLLAVSLGGAAGAVARALLGEAFTSTADGFPWTTFTINVVGCFLLGLLPAVAAIRRSEVLLALVGTGVLGGFTTLSAAAEDSRTLLDAGRTGTALLYLLSTLTAALAAVALAARIADGRAPGDDGDLP